MQTRVFIARIIKSHHSNIFLTALLGCAVFCSTPAISQGDLLIYPKRVVFNGPKRVQDLNLANTGKDTARYIISVVQIRMKEDGGFETISQPDSGQSFADKYIRIFPRKVVLAPNEAQTVKVQLTNIGQLLPGEYRSHLYFRAEEDKSPLGEPGPLKDSTSISVNIVAVFGITLPVIIRMGESSTTVHFSNTRFEIKNDTIPTVKMTFNRAGNMSTYGDVAVDHISLQGKITRVGIMKGISVYCPNTARHSEISLDKNPAINYHSGKLLLTYSDQSIRPLKLAEAEIVLH